MIKWIQNLEKSIFYFFKSYGKCILSEVGIGFIAYFMMMSLNLVNDLDGIWHLSNFIAGDWEISLGRGLQRYADRARFGIVSDSFNSIITISLIAIANAVILMRFQLDNLVYKVLLLTILIANPVVCRSLSYSYMSVNFGLAYFFSVLSFSCIENENKNDKGKLLKVFLGAFCLGISMAFYQAYICVTCVLVVSYIIKMLLEKQRIKNILSYVGMGLGLIVLGGIFYLLIVKLLLFRAGIQMASYKGASNINLLLMIKSMPESIKQCYLQFLDFIWRQKTLSDLEFIDIVLFGLCAVYIFSVGIQIFKIWKYSVISAVMLLIMVGLLPIASCVVLLIAVGNSMTGLMVMGILMCIVMLGIIIPKEGKIAFWMQRIYAFFLVAFAWFQLSTVENDQLALKEGKTATITLTENIVSELYSKGYLEEEKSVALVGRPSDNDRFAQSTAYQMANGYAKFGCWSTDARNNRVSWNGVLYNFLGVNLNLCGDTEYQQIVNMEQVATMPEFPMEGSICVIDDVVVVKVSDLY